MSGQVNDLTRRVERLERRRTSHTRIDDDALQELLGHKDLEIGSDADVVVYAVTGQWSDGVISWQLGREWDDVLSAAGEPAARVLAALANDSRLRIVAELLRGGLSTADLTERLGQPSTGQLFHHLKELIAAGVVHQPFRGNYEIRSQHVVPLLVIMSAAQDLASQSSTPIPDEL